MPSVPDASTKTESPSGDSSSTGAFLCVCGELIRVTSSVNLQCAHCSRVYSHDAVRRYGAETRTLEARAGFNPPTHLTPREPGGPPAPDKTTDVLPAGSRLGHFEIVSVIGRGGVGMVYKALDTSLNRYVALKVIRTHANVNKRQEFVDRLFEEARAQARINHTNVVHVYYVGREGQIPYLAMELVNGPTLSRQIHAGALPFERVVHYAIQVTEALEHAARFDIVHGDVKPSNMLVSGEDRLKLSDFGQASRVSDSAGKQGVIAGTPNYIPPESDYGKNLGISGDMYMLGVSFFEMTFGRLPYTFKGGDFRAKLQVHRTASVEFPDPWPAEVPEGWRAVLGRLLAKQPEHRYPDYLSLLSDLYRLRPSALASASRLARGVAWVIDLTLFGLLQAAVWLVLLGSHGALRTLGENTLFYAILVGNFFSPLLASLLQAAWGTSVGKHLLNLRIVDRHGQPLRRLRLGLRMAAQMFPLWIFGVVQILEQDLWLDDLNPWLQVAAVWLVASDILVALVNPRGRSLHDLLFATRVVYDLKDLDLPRNAAP
jgi:uncharacterized RDD family membrane protein YckC